jgi:hypothetical protein
MMLWPFPFEISYACRAFHFSHTFYRLFFNILLDYILHYIPPKIYILIFHNQCLDFYLKQTMLFLEFIIFFEDNIIVERFDSLGLFQNLLQPFIKSHLPLQILIHLCLFLVRLPLHFIFGLIYITNILFELL